MYLIWNFDKKIRLSRLKVHQELAEPGYILIIGTTYTILVAIALIGFMRLRIKK